MREGNNTVQSQITEMGSLPNLAGSVASRRGEYGLTSTGSVDSQRESTASPADPQMRETQQYGLSNSSLSPEREGIDTFHRQERNHSLAWGCKVESARHSSTRKHSNFAPPHGQP